MQQPISPNAYTEAFSARHKPKGWSLWYSSALVVVAFGMVLLPLFYISLIGLVGYGIWSHISVNAGPFLGAGAGLIRLFLFLIPVVIGVVLLFFMLKPLFAVAPDEPDVPEHPWEDEQRLYAFVCALCRHIGAPIPSGLIVDCSVNASAGFRRGSLLSNDLILHIGLPLVAGLSLGQFSGILAHEFGHFTQSFGMRLTYLVRSINMWFARVVYERDDWDAKLDLMAEDHPWFIVQIPALLARLMVRLVRRILWVLMLLGHGISSLMLRQMEFDADRYAAHVSGSKDMEFTLHETHKMDLGAELAYGVLQEQWSEGRICHNVPQLIAAKAANMPSELEELMRAQWDLDQAGWFDSHPSPGDRAKLVASLNAPGVLQLKGPATQLFSDFTALAKCKSLELYTRMFGEEEVARGALFGAEDLLAIDQQSDEEIEAGGRVWRELLAAACPSPAGVIVMDLEIAHEDVPARLSQLRETVLKREPEAIEAVKAYLKACEGGSIALHLRELLQCDFPIDAPEDFDVPEATLHAAIGKRRQHKEEAEEAFARLSPFFEVQVERISLCLSLWQSSLAEDGLAVLEAYTHTQVEELLVVLGVLYEQRKHTRELLEHLDLMQWHVNLHQVLDDPPPPLTMQALSLTKRVNDDLGTLRNQLRGIDYPFVHASGARSLGQFLVASLPVSDDPLSTLQQLEQTVHATARLYVRGWGVISRIVEGVEDLFGFAQMEGPDDSFLEDSLKDLQSNEAV